MNPGEYRPLSVVGGTAVGDEQAPAVWDDEQEGVARLLRAALTEGLTRVAIIGFLPSGDLYVASTGRSAEETIGYFMRGVAHLDRWIMNGGEGSAEPTDTAS